MWTSRLRRRAYLLAMLSALSVLGMIAMPVLREGLMAGRAEAWLVMWVLGFVLGLPALLLILPAMSGWLRLARLRDNVPHAGGNIP